MAKATLIESGEKVALEVSLQTATILYQLIGRFNPEAAGPLLELHEELEDLGIENYDNLFIVTQNEPTLFLQLVEAPVDNQEEE